MLPRFLSLVRRTSDCARFEAGRLCDYWRLQYLNLQPSRTTPFIMTKNGTTPALKL